MNVLQNGYMGYPMCGCLWKLGQSSPSGSNSSRPKAVSTTGVGLAKPSLLQLVNEKAEPEKFQDFQL